MIELDINDLIKVGGENSFLNRVYIERFLPLREASCDSYYDIFCVSYDMRDTLNNIYQYANYSYPKLFLNAVRKSSSFITSIGRVVEETVWLCFI